MKVNRQLAKDAKKQGICKGWFDKLQATEDKKELIQIYLKGIDFCLSNEYPTLPFIREHFVGMCEEFGVFVDDQIKVTNPSHVVALGKCIGSVRYEGHAVGQVFAKHDSKLTITATGNAFVMVDVFDNTEVHVIATESAKICVNHYGGEVTSETEGNAVVKIKEKQSNTY